MAAGIRENSRILAEDNETNRVITSSIKNKYKDAKKDEAAKNNTNDMPAGDLASLIATGVVLGNNQVKVKGTTTAFTGSKPNTTTIKPADDGVSDHMLRVMELGKKDNNDENYKKSDELLFIYPNSFNSDTEPGSAFVALNEDIITKDKIDLRYEFKKSDTVYNNNKVQIEGLKQSIPGFRVAVVDGIEDGKVKSVNSGTFHYKLIESFMGTKIPAAKYIDIKPEEKATTVLVVSDENSLNN